MLGSRIQHAAKAFDRRRELAARGAHSRHGEARLRMAWREVQRALEALERVLVAALCLCLHSTLVGQLRHGVDHIAMSGACILEVGPALERSPQVTVSLGMRALRVKELAQ